ncbi:hypothetical protein BC567DRAFT_57684 [Phyllosticta citribraziliensis]
MPRTRRKCRWNCSGAGSRKQQIHFIMSRDQFCPCSKTYASRPLPDSIRSKRRSQLQLSLFLSPCAAAEFAAKASTIHSVWTSALGLASARPKHKSRRTPASIDRSAMATCTTKSPLPSHPLTYSNPPLLAAGKTNGSHCRSSRTSSPPRP